MAKVMDLQKDGEALSNQCAHIKVMLQNYITEVGKLGWKEAERLCIDLRERFYDTCFDLIEEA
jgi:hypothetical protein